MLEIWGSYNTKCIAHMDLFYGEIMYTAPLGTQNLPNALWGFLHLKSELIREAENQKTDKNHRKTVKYGSIFEGEITKQLKK